MKAERRHELQHNELADWLAATAERLRPYSRAILGVTIAAVVLLLAYYLITSRRKKAVGGLGQVSSCPLGNDARRLDHRT